MEENIRRIDWDRVQFVGARLTGKWPWLSTGATEDEDCGAGDFSAWTVDARGAVENEWLVEVKSVGARFEAADRRFYPLQNPKWVFAPVEGGRKYWMLNALNLDGTLGKGMVMRNEGIALAYLFKDGVLYFSPKRLYEATELMGIYKCPQRTEFEPEKRKETCQAKLLVDLSKGIWLPCDVPERLFDFSTHPDFNTKNNARRKYISLEHDNRETGA